MKKETSLNIICFRTLTDVKGSSTCFLWVYTSKWFHYFNNVQEETVTHDNETVNFNASLSHLISMSFYICKCIKEINLRFSTFPTMVKLA